MFNFEKVSKPLEIAKNVFYIVTLIIVVGIAWGSSTATTANSTSDIAAIKTDIHNLVEKVDKLTEQVAYMKGQLQADHDRKK